MTTRSDAEARPPERPPVKPPSSRYGLGDQSARTLLPMQAFHSAGESFFALSLIGSLFFNVSVDAARPRILLYLAVTMAPFAVLGPLIGPIIDRFRGGHRMVLVVSLGSRALVAALLSSQLKTLLLYPEAFAIVVMAKVYVVSRNALVPVTVDDRDHLVLVNSRLARVGAISGAAAAIVGLAIMQVGDASWVLRGGAIAYGLGALSALRIPPPHIDENTSEAVESTEMHGPGIRGATIGMATLRMATGFIVFHVGFALKTSGQPAWLIVAVGGSVALGGLSGTFAAPQLRRRFSEQQIMTAALALLAAAALVASLRFVEFTALFLALALGLAGSIGRRAFDEVIQTEAPHARRGRAYAGLETRLELAWVIGSLVAVIARSPDWLGLLGLAVGVGLVIADRVASEREASRIQAHGTTATLPLRLLETAEAMAARGDRQQAVLVALAAADAARLAGHLSSAELLDLQRRCERAAIDNDPAAEDEALRLAHQLITESGAV